MHAISRFILGSTLAFAFATSAQALAADEVTTINMKNGSSVRGELVERVPGDKIVLKLATGEVRVIPWNDIAHTEEPASQIPKQRVDVQSDHAGTQLQRITGQASGVGYAGGRSVYVAFESWENICVAPCSANVDPNGTYRVDAPGMTPSKNFQLPAPTQQPLKLKIQGGSAAMRIGGAYSLTFGITGLLMGAIFLPIGFAAEDKLSTSSLPQTFQTIGLVSLGVGAGLTALGIYLVAMSGTDVKTDAGRELAKRNGPKFRLTPQGFAF